MSKMIDPYDMPEELACGPTSPPSLQTDSAEDIVHALAESNPLYEHFIGAKRGESGLLRPVFFTTCALCQREIPDGHGPRCPWWLATLFVRKKREREEKLQKYRGRELSPEETRALRERLGFDSKDEP